MGIGPRISTSQINNQGHFLRAMGNPNPRRYEILGEFRYNGYLILKIKYPDATNYEGVKILMFAKGTTLPQLTGQGYIDPHFDPKGIHPIARFEPTDRGLLMAMKLAEAMA